MSQSRKRKSHTPKGIQGRRQKALFLPMPREDAERLMLRTRMTLERVRNGEADRVLLNSLAQVVLFANFVTVAGYGTLERSFVDGVEHQLGLVLLTADQTGEWHIPPQLVEALTQIVNEYDRQLRETRLEVIANATEQLDRLMKTNR